MIEIAQIERIQRRKQHTLIGLVVVSVLLLLTFLFRLVPRLNDFLAGRPQYAKALTTLMAQEIARAAGETSPLILLGEDEHCSAVPRARIKDDEIAEILYVLTYSERQRFSCITSYVVPTDPSRFTELQILSPKPQWTSGPLIARPWKVIPVARSMHVYPSAYLESLHWRVRPHFPLSEDQAEKLAARQYESRNPTVRTDEHAGISVDFAKARTLVRFPHDRANTWLLRIIATLVLCQLGFASSLVQPYREISRYLSSHGDRLTVRDFLRTDISRRACAARMRHHEREHERLEQERKTAAELALREELGERLRFLLNNLKDEELRQRISQCLAEPVDSDLLKHLYAEARKVAGVKSPEQRLAVLLGSLEPFFTEEELNLCRAEAMKLLQESGFRAARNYLVSRHDEFRLRKRNEEEKGETAGEDIEAGV